MCSAGTWIGYFEEVDTIDSHSINTFGKSFTQSGYEWFGYSVSTYVHLKMQLQLTDVWLIPPQW